MTFRKIIDLFLITLIVAHLGVSYYLSRQMNREMPVTGSVFIKIKKGETATAIGHNLKQNGLLAAAGAFRLAYSLYFSPRYLRAGEYLIESPSSPKKIMLQMIAGQVYLHAITIPEGLTIKEIGEILEAKSFPYEGSFQEACRNVRLISDLDPEASDLEGYLFPETYYLPAEISAEEIVRVMVERFKKVFHERYLARANELKMSVRDVITLASLIEKETARAEEKPLVSAVFHNRLRLGMKLDCDPTIIYALKLEDRFDGNIRLKDKALDSPYNTYLYRGLPPGPICNPGLDSIEAALYPAPVDYLYFVSRNDGSHVFSRSYQEHQKAVIRYQLKKRGKIR